MPHRIELIWICPRLHASSGLRAQVVAPQDPDELARRFGDEGSLDVPRLEGLAGFLDWLARTECEERRQHVAAGLISSSRKRGSRPLAPNGVEPQGTMCAAQRQIRMCGRSSH